MAYEKLVQLLATEDTLDAKKLCLTEPDITQYIARHLSSQKRACSMSDKGDDQTFAA
jgi:trimethylamine:corrinoid methyltransferase-like protein